MMIYVVLGSVGEHSDRDEWLVKAFRTEDAAKAHVERCGQRGRELVAEFDRLEKELERRTPRPGDAIPEDWNGIVEANFAARRALRNEHDTNMETDYMNRPGDTYWYEAVELDNGE